MATDFNYANTITAATPAVAAEVQDNFDDVLTWIKAYYQQTLDTTAEIAAAIAAQPGTLGTATMSAAITAMTEADGLTDVPGLSVTFTAEVTHLYRYSMGGRIIGSSGTTSPFRIRAKINNIDFFDRYFDDAVDGLSNVSGGIVYQTGISGSTTVKVQVQIYGAGGFTLDLNDAGTAVMLVVEDLGVAP